MFTRLARPALIAAAAAAAITAIPAAASAQSYGYGHGGYVSGYGGQTYNYPDYCERNRQGRTGAGAVIGAGAGAVIGSQLAARGRRTEGSILGGVLGAVVGGAAGRGSGDRCYGYDNRYQGGGYSSGGYAYSPNPPAYHGGYGYSSGYSYAPSYSSGYGYSSSSTYYDADGYGPYAYEPRHDDRYGYGGGYYDRDDRDRDGCRLAESRIRLPDGRSETRYVRTCPDSSGRYRVVD
ncbi:MAG: glycine zipper 2TM domain-containing protein [Brevundimonas sp.]|uniref:glycine zipper 2TM domain-containing protein n=1 Tax=Brevundimonas sp. TaxID=1871086 RepID=UPI004033D814